MGRPISSRRFTVREYYRMAEAGILKVDERLELLEGEIVKMSPIRERHASCVTRIHRLLERRAGDRAIIRVQNPVRLGSFSEPEPDVAIVRSRADWYAKAHPGPSDVLLLIEVCDTTYERDRRRKVPLYARYGIREVWLVDLDHGRVEVHREPGSRGFREIRTAAGRSRITSKALPVASLTLRELLG